MNGIIVYRSTYGSTKQYAEWIHEETGFPLYDQWDTKIPWGTTGMVVIGCPIIANKPSLAGWIRKNRSRLKGKEVLLFTTSGADPTIAPVREWIETAFPAELRSSIRFFPLAGRFDFRRLSGFHKLVLRLAACVFRDEGIRNQIEHPVDGVARENLQELLQRIVMSAAPQAPGEKEDVS
jgi:menaquinone-dependent protoporphyrinogen IX oxidase